MSHDKKEFLLLSTDLTDQMFLSLLVTAVRSRNKTTDVGDAVKAVNARLIHTVTYGEGEPVQTAVLRLNHLESNEDGISDNDSKVLELTPDIYNAEPLTEFIKEVVRVVNTTIDEGVMCGNFMESAEIAAEVEKLFKGYLNSYDILDGYNVSVSVVEGGITQVIVTVA